MNRRNGFYRFDLNDKFVFYEDVDSKANISQLYILIDDWNRHFRFYI